MKHLDTMKRYAIEHDVPIMPNESIEFVSKTLNENKAATILEIGAAIAFSASALVLDNPNRKIDTLERDKTRYMLAIENVDKLGLSTSIHVILADAHHYCVEKPYDALIIDASKAQNLSFFKLFFAYTDTVCIIDNVNYHGFVDQAGFETIYSRSLRSMVKRIREFKEYLNSRTDLIVVEHDIGDGMMVIKRK